MWQLYLSLRVDPPKVCLIRGLAPTEPVLEDSSIVRVVRLRADMRTVYEIDDSTVSYTVKRPDTVITDGLRGRWNHRIRYPGWG